MLKSQHWYDRDGRAVFEVPKAKGDGMRPTTIADARRLNLYPSVTTVLSVLAKPSLDDWKMMKVAEACYKQPPIADESLDDYTRVILDKAFDEASNAADLGTRIHAAIEAHFKGQAVPDEMQVYVRPVVGALERTGIKLLQHELRLVNHDEGYAGTTDAVMVLGGQQGILDFKSRKTKPGQLCEPWETEPMQIAAYTKAKFGADHYMTVGANVYISTTEVGRVEIVTYDDGQLHKAWHAFQAANSLWQYLRKYRPSK